MKRSFRLIPGVLILFTVYVLYSSSLSSLTTISGFIVVSILVTYVSRYLDITHILKPGKIMYLFRYLVSFVKNEIREHLWLSRVILKRKILLNPGFIELPLDVKSNTSISLIALTITNIPGTIAVDIEDGVMIVHWINITAKTLSEAKKAVFGDFEEIAREVFG